MQTQWVNQLRLYKGGWEHLSPPTPSRGDLMVKPLVLEDLTWETKS